MADLCEEDSMEDQSDGDQESLTRAEQKQPRERKHKCTHEGCTQAFYYSWHLKRHMRLHQDDGRPEVCVICNQRFTKKSALRLHVSRTHAKNPEKDGTTPEAIEAILNCKPYECTYADCKKTYTTEGQLKKHLKRHEQKKHVCAQDNCNKSFAFRKELLKHVKDYHPPKPEDLTCQQCGKTFKSRAILVGHVREIHNKADIVHQCPFDGCNKVFKKRSNLNNHVRTIHERTERGIWKCVLCNSKPNGYATKYILKKHYKKVHQMDNDYIDVQIALLGKKPLQGQSGATLASTNDEAVMADARASPDALTTSSTSMDNGDEEPDEVAVHEPPTKKRKTSYAKAGLNTFLGEAPSLD